MVTGRTILERSDGTRIAGDGDIAATTTVPVAARTAPASPTTTSPTTTIPPTRAPRPQAIVSGIAITALSPAELAAQITLVEQTIADPTAPPDRFREAARAQQLQLRLLGTDPDLVAATVPLVGEPHRFALEQYLLAGHSIDSLVTPQESLPRTWRIVQPPPAGVLRGYFQEAEALSGIPWQYFAAIASTATRMGRIQRDGDGPQGPMQFLPRTWERYGEGGNIHDFRDSVLAASRLLTANGAPGNMDNALYRYNPSSSFVNLVQRLAQRMLADERQYYALYEWQVLYSHVDGVALLPEGWPDVPHEIVAPLER
jgi:hypothetical protein